jgi:hypothetical protein
MGPITTTPVPANWRDPVDDYFEQDMTEEIFGSNP